MWIKLGASTWYNLGQVIRFDATISGSSYEVRGTFPHSASPVTLRTFATLAEAQNWVADVLDNVRED